MQEATTLQVDRELAKEIRVLAAGHGKRINEVTLIVLRAGLAAIDPQTLKARDEITPALH